MNQIFTNLKKSNFVLAICLCSFSLTAQKIDLEPIGTYRDGSFDESAAEIVKYDPKTYRLFAVNADKNTVDIIDISNPYNPTLISQIELEPYGAGPNSVDVKKGRVAVAVEADESTDPGKVVIFNTDGVYQMEFPAGSLPDGLAFSPNGRYIVVANEGEPNDEYTVDPEGSVTVIDVVKKEAIQLDFTRYNNKKDQLINRGIRIFGPNATVAQDLEPEFVTISDNQMAYITLQENNAIAVVDLNQPAIKKLIPLGYKDHSLPGNGIDASNRDDAINIANWPVLGLYLPDAIGNFRTKDRVFLITANEGDSRDYDGFSEEERVEDLVLDPNYFPDAASLQDEANLGRLKITTTMGAVDGVYQKLYSYGARSFSIWDAASGKLVYDSGDDFEQITAELIPDYFNSNNDDNDSFDSRSDDKGPEPEAIEIAYMGPKVIAFIGLERLGGIMIYDVSNPRKPEFLNYVNNRNFDADAETAEALDLGVESLTYIPHSQSPNHKPLLVSGNEVSGTVTVFEIKRDKDMKMGQEKYLSMFPVPLKEKLNIKFAQEIAGNVEVTILHALSGQELSRQSHYVTNRELSLDVSSLERGTYIFNITQTDGLNVRRVLVK